MKLVETGKTRPAAQGQRQWISKEQAAAIRRIDHFCNSEYQHLDLDAPVDEYVCNFVDPLLALNVQPRARRPPDCRHSRDRTPHSLAGGIDRRHPAGRSRNRRRVLRQSDRVHRRGAGLYGRAVPHQQDVLVITSPNKLFPIIKHDTVLPFCRWLPLRARTVYADMFGRRALQHNNLFWSPRKLLRAVDGFECQSRFLQFASHAQYRQAQPAAAGRSGWVDSMQSPYFSAVGRTGRMGIFLLPNLASTFRRKA